MPNLFGLFGKSKSNNTTEPDMSGYVQTHDYRVSYWGHDYSFKTYDNGQTLELIGWGQGIKKNDYLLLKNGNDSTRYQIKSIKYQSNPSDMWFATARFAPRSDR